MTATHSVRQCRLLILCKVRWGFCLRVFVVFMHGFIYFLAYDNILFFSFEGFYCFAKISTNRFRCCCCCKVILLTCGFILLSFNFTLSLFVYSCFVDFRFVYHFYILIFAFDFCFVTDSFACLFAVCLLVCLFVCLFVCFFAG